MSTLVLPVVLFLRRRRLLLGMALAQGAVLMWALVYRIDRNLQIVLPWLVAATAAAIAGAWQSGWLARAALVPLVLLQVAWGTKIFLAGGIDRLNSFMALVRGDFDPGPKRNRYAHYREQYRDTGSALPADAVLLLHTAHLQLGIGRRTLSDWAGFQYLIDYRLMKTPRDVYLRYREVGITHVIWNNYDFPASKQEDVLFFAFTRRHAVARGAPGGFSLWQMPSEPPPVERPMKVVAMGLNGYHDGLYSIEQMGVIEDWPPEKKLFPAPAIPVNAPAEVAPVVERADAVVLADRVVMDPRASEQLSRCFSNVHHYYAGYAISGYSVYLRNKGVPSCNAPAR